MLDRKDVAQNDHNFRPSEFLLSIVIAVSEVSPPDLLVISVIETPVSRFK